MKRRCRDWWTKRWCSGDWWDEISLLKSMQWIFVGGEKRVASIEKKGRHWWIERRSRDWWMEIRCREFHVRWEIMLFFFFTLCFIVSFILWSEFVLSPLSHINYSIYLSDLVFKIDIYIENGFVKLLNNENLLKKHLNIFINHRI